MEHPVETSPQPTAARSDPSTLIAEYQRVRAITERLAAPLSDEDQQVQAMPDASPVKWHRAHTTWFFETFVASVDAPDYSPIDDRYCFLYNSYYEAVGSRYPRAERGLQTRPSAADVRAYRDHVDAAVVDLLARTDLTREQRARVFERVTLGLHHEQQHQELLLMDVKHALSRNEFDPAYRRPIATDPAPLPRPSQAARWIEVPGGLVGIGSEPGGEGFAFDSEGPRHTVHLEPFRIADRLVTNAEWLAFIEDDGYSRPDLWLADGFGRAQAERWHAPLYWEQDGPERWTTLTLDGRAPLEADAPVCHVSQYEADAFARWRDARLPTEFEWEHAVRDDARAPGPANANLMTDPTSGSLRTRPAAGAGLRQAFGDVWEWTASAYLPYPRFRPAPGAIGEYNGKFMSGQIVLRGGSCITPHDHIRASYRNFFYPHQRWMYGGVRLASDA